MTAKVAPLEIDELAVEVADLLNGGHFDAPRLRQIQVRADRLLHTGGAPRQQSLNVLVLAAYGLGSRADAERHVEAVLKDQWALPAVLENCARVLLDMGSIEMALQLTERMVDKHPDVKSVLAAAANNYELALHLTKAADMVSRYDKLSINDPSGISEKFRNMVSNSTALAQGLGLTDEETAARLELAVQAVRSSGVEIRRMNRLVLHDGSFISHFYVAADAGTCAELNFVIIDALVEAFDNLGTELFSIACRPFADYADTHQAHSK